MAPYFICVIAFAASLSSAFGYKGYEQRRVPSRPEPLSASFLTALDQSFLTLRRELFSPLHSPEKKTNFQLCNSKGWTKGKNHEPAEHQSSDDDVFGVQIGLSDSFFKLEARGKVRKIAFQACQRLDAGATIT